MAGVLYLVATPIGNLEDITLRAIRILREEVSAIACEDTRQTQKLLDHFAIKKPLLSYHEHNEAARAIEIAERLGQGESIAIVSDAGTPLISDPGYRAVVAAIGSGYAVVPLPGPSAALAALAASGLAVGAFRFIGFLPPKSHARQLAFEALKTEPATVVAYESPHRIIESLNDLQAVLADRPLVLARELTKVHEEFMRGTAAEIRDTLAARPSVRGEMTLVIGGCARLPFTGDPKEAVDRLEKDGADRMEAIKVVAKQMGLPKRELYRRLRAEPADAAGPGSSVRGKRRD